MRITSSRGLTRRQSTVACSSSPPTGAVLLTFLAGAELDPSVIRRSSGSLGRRIVGFPRALLPAVPAVGSIHPRLGRSLELPGGIAALRPRRWRSSTRSCSKPASQDRFREGHPGACFVTTWDTVIVLGSCSPLHVEDARLLGRQRSPHRPAADDPRSSSPGCYGTGQRHQDQVDHRGSARLGALAYWSAKRKAVLPACRRDRPRESPPRGTCGCAGSEPW